MLFEVPVNRPSQAQKPLKVVSHPASAILGPSRTTKMRANYDIASVRKPRDDSFDESLLPVTVAAARHATNPIQPTPAMEAFEVEDNVSKDPEISAILLN